MVDFVDEDVKRYHREMSPRPVTCPDGVTRIVTLQNWTWDALDFLEARHGYERREVIAFIWEVANRGDPGEDRDYRFTSGLAYYVHRHMAHVSQSKGDTTNDNWYAVEG